MLVVAGFNQSTAVRASGTTQDSAALRHVIVSVYLRCRVMPLFVLIFIPSLVDQRQQGCQRVCLQRRRRQH